MSRRRSRDARVSWGEFYAEPLELQRMLSWQVAHAPLIDELASAQRVLEVGTGTGAIAALLGQRGAYSVSVDIEPKVQVVARENAATLRGHVVFVGGDAFSLPFRDDAFDAAYSQGFFEHFDDTQIRDLLNEQLRVAKRVVFSVPNVLYPHIGRWGPGLIGNERLMTRSRWAQLLSEYSPRVLNYRDPKVLSIAGVAFGPRMHTLAVLER